MLQITLKWGKETVQVAVPPTATPQEFRAAVASATGVPAEKQKIMGTKVPLANAGVVARDFAIEGKPLMLIGTAESLPSPPPAAVFAEDQPGGHTTSAPSTNGLVNVGNTCYMNSAVQALRMMPELRSPLARSGDPVAKELARLLNALDGSRDAVAPMTLWVALMATHPNFGEADSHGHPMQHDSQEALSVFLQAAQQQIVSAPADYKKYQRLLTGSMLQVSEISNAAADGGIERKEETLPFTILPCNITGEVQTLEAGLEQAMKETIVSEPAVASDTGSAAPATPSIKRVAQLSSLPEYLVVHFVRFHWRRDINAKTKVLKPITFPLVLDVQSLCTETLRKEMEPARQLARQLRDAEVERRKRQRQKSGHDEAPDAAANGPKSPQALPPPEVLHNENGLYELCAVISHKGRDADGGHYVCWVLKGGTWLVVDDANVAPVSTEDIQRLRGVGEAHIAYVLVYRSRDPVTGSIPMLM